MCNVRPEDSGEVKFIARRVESVAYLDVEGKINILLQSQCAEHSVVQRRNLDINVELHLAKSLRAC